MDKLILGTRKGLILYKRDSDGWRHWRTAHLGNPVAYAFCDARNKTLWATLDHGHWGQKLQRSLDWGETWEDANLPQPTNSTPWMVATHTSDADLLFTCTNLGQMFRSTDGGEAWTKLPRELGEIRTMLWHPA